MHKASDRTSRPKVVIVRLHGLRFASAVASSSAYLLTAATRVNRALILNDKKDILLIQRSKNDSYMPGKWEFPGGKLDAGQDISNALEREVLEETSLVVIPTDKIAYWHSEILTSGKYAGMPYVVLIGIAKSVGGNVALSSEHDGFAWVDKKNVLKYGLTHETRMAVTVLIGKI